MNKLVNIIAFIALGFFGAGCDGDTGVNIPEKQLKVTEAKVIFETAGGTGFVKVSAPGQVTAKSDQNWCAVSVSGTTVNLAVSENTGLGGRTATVTIESGGETVNVTAVQTSAIFWLKDFKDGSISFLCEGSTVKTAVESSFPVVINSKPDWISYKFEGDSLYLTASASPPRKESITFSSAGRTMTYSLVQASYVGLIGEWDMEFDNPTTGRRETRTVTFVEKEKNVSFTLDGLVITGEYIAKIEMKFNPSTNRVTISAGQYLANIPNDTGDFVYLGMRTSGGTYSPEGTIQLAGSLGFDGDGKVTYTFGDNGTWSGQVAGGFGFYLYKGQPASSTTATGSSYVRFMNIVMTKK